MIEFNKLLHPSYFYPRSPCGERRRSNQSVISQTNDFYPRSPCGERRKSNKLAGQKLVFLSTLSLRRATTFIIYSIIDKCISIHALLAESDQKPLRHAVKLCYFYPRSPCGERRQGDLLQCPGTGISIHALLAESDR